MVRPTVRTAGAVVVGTTAVIAVAGLMLAGQTPEAMSLAEPAGASGSSFEARKARHDAKAASFGQGGEAKALLHAVRQQMGEPRNGWRRLVPGGWPGEGQLRDYGKAAEEIEAARGMLLEGASLGRGRLVAVGETFRESAHAGVYRSRIEARIRELDARLRQADEGLSLARDRAREAASPSTGRMLRYWRSLTGGDAASTVAEVEEMLGEWSGQVATPILGSELSYVEGAFAPAALPAGTITPAYASATLIVPSLEDSTLGREVELSPEVKAKAGQLGTPKAAYEFVKNEVRLEWYLGCMKGSTETLRQGRGNDADLAALLVALLRAQDVPARFVRGTIQLPVGKLADLMGLLTAQEVDALYGPAQGPVPAGARDQALRALTAAGIPYEPVTAGGTVAAVKVSHVWVEAYLPYADYRGVGDSAEGKQWIALDPGIPGTAKYAAVPAALDALAELGTTAAALTGEYLASGAGVSPLQFVRAKLEAFLAASRPGTPYSAAQRTVEQRKEDLSFLPGSLPYEVISVHGEDAFLPETLKHRIHLVAQGPSGVLMDANLPMHQLLGHRAVFAYKPATEADKELVMLEGGYFEAPAALVEVLPVVRVDGRELSVGTRSVGLGATHAFTIELLLPDGSARRVENQVIAGNVVALGMGGPGNGFAESPTEDPADTEGPAGRFLYGRAVAYANGWTEGEEELSRLLGVVPVRPTANLAMVRYQLAVEESLGIRQRVSWKGLEVDADLRTMTPLELTAGRGKELLRLSGYQGSYLESQVLAEGTGSEAVSATTVLQTANENGAQVLSITPANAATELPKLIASGDVARDIADQVARGREVLVPAQPMTIQNWTGAGYIVRDPNTEEGGYFLSGIVSGGMTILSPASWTDDLVLEALARPDAPASTNDLSRVARIIVLPGTNFQSGIVGKPLPRALAAIVTTIDWVPVFGASVLFKGEGASQPRLAPAGVSPPDPGSGALSLYARTDTAGVARVEAMPDTIIGHRYVEAPGTPYAQWIGLNEVRARTSVNDIQIIANEVFTFAGSPDAPSAVVRFHPGAEYLGFITGNRQYGALQARLQDRWGNAIANKAMSWSMALASGREPKGRFFDCSEFGPATRVLSDSDPGLTPTRDGTTDDRGTTCVGFIAAAAAFLDDATHTVTATSEGFAASWKAVASAKPSYELRVSSSSDAEAGVVGTSWAGPWGVELFGPDGRFTDKDPSVASMAVWFEIRSPAGRLLYHERTVPSAVEGSAAGFDTDTMAVFWPRFEVEGSQVYTFGADVVFTEGGVYDPAKAQWMTEWHPRRSGTISGVRPKVRVARSPLDGVQTVTSRCAPVKADDLAITVVIENPSTYGVFARIEEYPSSYGEKLVTVPGPEEWPRHPDDPTLIAIPHEVDQSLTLPLVAGNRGGQLVVSVWATDVANQRLIKATERRVPVAPPGQKVLTEDSDLSATIVLPVRSFASAKGPQEEPADESEPPQAEPAELPVEPPFMIPAPLDFCVAGYGTLIVTSGGTPISAAILAAGPGGTSVTPVSESLPVPTVRLDGSLRVNVLPGDLGGQEVALEFQPHGEGEAAMERSAVWLKTQLRDAGAFPVGHSFVKDVSVVDGHIARQFSDLAIPGRGDGLHFERSYSSRGLEQSPLGDGWTHSYRSYVIPEAVNGSQRYLLSGGEGTGQVFTCGGDSCTNQRGYHGKFAVAGDAATFTSLSGTVYTYGRLDSTYYPPRMWLTSVADPSGHGVTLEYDDGETDEDGRTLVHGELTSVEEKSSDRRLRLTYEPPVVGSVPALKSVKALIPDVAGFGGRDMTVGFAYDDFGNLIGVTRTEDGITRKELYSYVASESEELRNNLASYTSPNGTTTEYTYFSEDDALDGEDDFTRFGDKRERVASVAEAGARYEFMYSLRPEKKGPRLRLIDPLFWTEVAGPRVGQKTTYGMDTHGSAIEVERDLPAGKTACRTTFWNLAHLKPEKEIDPRGVTFEWEFDGRGNRVAKWTRLDREIAEAVGLLDALNADGDVVPRVVERWSFDPDTNKETCRHDREGRVVTTKYVDGLPILRRTYATPLANGAPLAGASCEALVASVAASASDRIEHWEYCELNGTCVAGAKKGDLVAAWEAATASSAERRTSIASYDSIGNPTVSSTAISGTEQIKTTNVFDGRSRLRLQSDSSGHKVVREYDGFDRLALVQRVDGTSKSTGEHRTYAYYPEGQMHWERIGTPQAPASVLERRYELDAAGRVKTITEYGAGLSVPQVSHYGYDAAGNRTVEVDRRGVLTQTSFDSGDRPFSRTVAVGNPALFASGHGDAAASGGGTKGVSAWEWDVAGNMLSETDLHGHKTSYVLDAFYRAVQVKHPAVPGLGSASASYVTSRIYDLVGNKVAETDGNGNKTEWQYDASNRLVLTRDAVGREEAKAFDAQGNLVGESTKAGGEERLSRTSQYDGLGRPIRTTETVAGAAASVTVAESRYDDAGRTTYSQDRRGFVTRRRLDGLDRVIEQTVDATGTPLAEPPGAGLATSTTTYEYDAGGRRRALVDAEGRRTEEDWDGLGRLIARRLPMGVLESFAYDGEGHLIWTKDRRGVERAFTFDLLGRKAGENLSPSVVPNGVSQVFSDVVGVRTQYIDQAGAGLSCVTTTVGSQRATSRWADALHREIAVVEADQPRIDLGTSFQAGGASVPGVRWSYWDAVNRRKVVDRRGHELRYEYDAANRLVGTVDYSPSGAALYSQSIAYRDDVREEEATDRSGIRTVTTKDGLGRVTGVVRGAGNAQTTDLASHDGNGNVVTKTDANGRVTRTVYDGANRALSETRVYGTPLAASTYFTWDKVGNRLTVKGPRGTWAFDEKVTYDDLNRPVRTEDAAGNVTTRAFDAVGNRLCEKRPLGGDPLSTVKGMTVAFLEATACAGGQVTRYAYDAESKLTSVVDSDGGEHSFVYDAVRNLLAKQDAKLNLTTYAYDLMDRRTDEWQHLDAHPRLRDAAEVPSGASEPPANPAAGTGSLHWRVAYDVAGNPTHAWDPRGYETVRTYGALNRLETETFQELPSSSDYPRLIGVAYAYTGNGALELRTETKRTAPDATVAELHDPEYDGLERLWKETRYDGKVVEYGYDAKGNRTLVRDPDLVETTYTFDAQDRLETATTPEGATTYGYLRDGLLQKTTLPNGIAEGRCYDPAGHLTTIVSGKGSVDATTCTAATTVSRFEYGYDANGNRLAQLERRTAVGGAAAGAVETTEYGYDALDRLVGVKYPDGTATLYRLDAVGNRTGERKTLAAKVVALTVAAFAAVQPADASSDLTNTYNRADWLVQQADAKDASRNATLSYDLAGNLTTKVKATGARVFAWDARGALASVTDGSLKVGRYDYDATGLRVKRATATETVEYVLDDGHVLQEADGAVAEHPGYRRYHYGYGPLSVTDAKGKRFIQTDALGSPTDLTSTSGAIASMRKYDAWGSYRDATAPQAGDEKLGYTGHQYDPETGLVYARARYYDPEVGLFLSRDPLDRSPLSAPYLHRYTWGRGNPLRYVDPTGWEEEELPKPPVWINDDGTCSDGGCQPEDPPEASDATVFRAEQRKAEEARNERERGLAQRDRERAFCARNPDAKGCRHEPQTVVEGEHGPTTVAIPDDPTSEIKAQKGAINARIRKVGKTGQEAVEAGMMMVPVWGTVYGLKLAADDVAQGNYQKALIEAGITLGPDVAVVLVRYGGRVVAKVISSDVTRSEKLLSNENVLRVLRFGEEGAEEAALTGRSGRYGDVGGHHVHAKAALKGHPTYDPRNGFAISQEFMAERGWSHASMTAEQRRLFDALATSGHDNTLREHTRIAVESLVAGGATEAEARSIVAESLRNLRAQGVTAPTRIPWN